MSPTPAGDRGLHVLQVPLQWPPTLSAAPAAVVLARGEHPPQPQLTEGLAAHPKSSASFGRRHPDPLTSGWGWCRLVLHQASSLSTLTTAGFQRIW